MAGDLEDFLRRAAERRQAKAANQPAQRPTQRPAAPPTQQSRGERQRQEYTNRNTERQTRQEEILVAEVVEEDPFAARRQKIADVKQLAARARAEASNNEKKTAAAKASAKKAKAASRAAAAASKVGPELDGDAIRDLLKLIQQPGGIQQAVLLREILDRPKW